MQRLIHPDQLPDPAGFHQAVQIRYCLAFHQLTPVVALIVHAEEIGHLLVIRHQIRLQIIGVDEHEAAGHGQDIPHLQIAGGRCQLAIVVIHEVFILIPVEVVLPAPGQQPCLILLAHVTETADRFCRGNPAADQRDVTADDPAYFLLQCPHREILRPGHGYVQARTHGAVHLGSRTGV